MLEIVYLPYTKLSVTRRICHQKSNTVVNNDVIPTSASLSSYLNHNSGSAAYFWDDTSGSVRLKHLMKYLV